MIIIKMVIVIIIKYDDSDSQVSSDARYLL